MHEPLQALMQRRAGALFVLLRKLVELPTVSETGESYLECAELLRRKLETLGFDTQIVEAPRERIREVLPEHPESPRCNVLGSWDVGAKETVHFNGHFDVAPAGEGWSLEPFNASLRDGIVYGRGVADMKGSLAAMIFALECMKEIGLKPAFNIQISFVCDEEIGGELGTRHLIESGLIKADYGVILEGASGPQIGVGHNGALWLQAELEGKSAHTSAPGEGVNAFMQMAELISHLSGYCRALEQVWFHMPDGTIMNASMTLGGRFGCGKESAVNVVPGAAWFTIDRRILPNETLEGAEKELRDFLELAADKIDGCKLSLKTLHASEPFFLEIEHPLCQSFASALTEARGYREARYYITPGFTDARYLGKALGIPTIGHGPGGANYHGADEHVSLEAITQTALVYATFMLQGVHAPGAKEAAPAREKEN